jgi:hypothetical protein
MLASSGDIFLKRWWRIMLGPALPFKMLVALQISCCRAAQIWTACAATGLMQVKPWAQNPRCLDENKVARKHQGNVMSEITQFIAVPIDRTDQGLVAGEAFKCASPQAAIERAKGFWQVMGHAGAVAAVRTGYPDTTTTVLRRFGSVPEQLEV